LNIRKKLELNTLISLAGILLVALSLAWSFHRDSIAARDMALAEGIRNVAFERILLRDEYLLQAEDGVKKQWEVKSETLRRLLDVADRQLTDGNDRHSLRNIRKEFDASFDSIFGFMEVYGKKLSEGAKTFHLSKPEMERIRLEIRKDSSLKDGIDKLHDSIQEKAEHARVRTVVPVAFFFIAAIIGNIIYSVTLSRELRKRIVALGKEFEIIGAGDLDHRLDEKGDDELSDLVRGCNEMAANLKMSHAMTEDLRQTVITRRRAEEENRESYKRLLAVIDSIGESIYVSDFSTHEILMVNRYVRDLAGDITGKICWQTMQQGQTGPCGFCTNHLLVTPEGFPAEPVVWEFQNTLTKRWYKLRDQAILWTDGRLVRMEIGTDITERRQMQEEMRRLEETSRQNQKLESLGVLAGGIAHDFNNLLTVILGNAEMMSLESPPGGADRGRITDILTAGNRAAELCRQMLAYAGKAPFFLERVDVGDLVNEMMLLLKPGISRKVDLKLNLERDLPPVVGDPSQIRQIVMNLVLNASEAIGDRTGEITMGIGTSWYDEARLRDFEMSETLFPGPYVHVEVTDTGCGMDAQTRSRIFEPFFSTKFTGRGLGLASVLGIVRAHKGALKVGSDPGKGTTFRVLFPALTETAKEILAPEPSSTAGWRGKGTILLVDDEESLLSLGTQMLEHLGFTVLTATDGLQAVDLYRERGKGIDLVLMDLTMPRMDGAEAFGELRRMNPDVRIVFASGYSREDMSERFEGKGLEGILQKPFTLGKLREALAGHLPERSGGGSPSRPGDVSKMESPGSRKP
jgi:signal transduction histidine kinase/CheY-like chemotaxis protein/PAS domain-containing protein